MADETTADKPLAELSAAEERIDAPVNVREPGDPRPSDRPPDTPDPEGRAADRLRAFEDKHFGKDAVRINGRIERGSGSLYQMAHPTVREQHARLEKLIDAEEKLALAHTALMQADTEHEMAEQAVADAEKDADAPND
jgi:hypothetical protein